MNFLVICGLAAGLAMDALAVSIVQGCVIKDFKHCHAFLIAGSFGLFQALMPVIGWAAGLTFSAYIQNYDHWVVFALLCFVGVKMIWEAFRIKDACEEEKNCLHLPTLLLLSLATSLDALAVGITFSMLSVTILRPVIIIGGITFIICLAGVYMGNKIGDLFKGKLGIIGGIILIGMGIKILAQHLSA